MGNVFSNSNKTKEEVEQDIKRINKITNNDLFFKKTLRTLNFELYSNFFNNIISSKIIFCSVYDEKKGLKYLERNFYIKLSQFYKFFNTVMNSLQIFYLENLVKKKTIEEITQGKEDDICPICEDKKVSVMLDCYHFFCESCIEIWLFKKKNNCPMCRHNINLEEFSPNNLKRNQWSLIELDKDEYLKECEFLFRNSFSELVGFSK